jgi:hypothetical protein
MDGSRLARWAPLTGVIFAVLSAVLILVGLRDSPDFSGPPEEYLQFFTDHKDDVMLGSAAGLISVLFLIWFLGTVGAMLNRAEGGFGRVAQIGVVGGAIGAGAWLIGIAAYLMPALRLDDQGKLSVELAAVFGDLSSILMGAAAPVGFGVLLLATALIGLRTKAIPVWLTWISLVFGLVMEVPWISFIGIFAFPVWVLIVAVLELTKASESTPEATPTPTVSPA